MSPEVSLQRPLVLKADEASVLENFSCRSTSASPIDCKTNNAKWETLV